MYKLQFKDNPGRSIWLVGEKITLGAAANNDVPLDGLGIKDQHAEIEIDTHRLNLKSVAGSCFVNELPVDGEYCLQANDELRIGKERLLIVDPKQLKSSTTAGLGLEPEGDNSIDSGWRLLAKHSQLQDREFRIDDRCIIGRSKDCDFSVPYKLLSREHAALYVKEGAFYLEDLGSANGCFVNGKRVESAQLENGDKIAFAKLVFIVSGPEKELVQQPINPSRASSETNEFNKTMVRPAVNLQAELQRLNESSADYDDSLEIKADTYTEPEEKINSSRSGRWTLISIVVIASVSAVMLFMLR